jgi:hypothetical protein
MAYSAFMHHLKKPDRFACLNRQKINKNKMKNLKDKVAVVSRLTLKFIQKSAKSRFYGLFGFVSSH